MTKPELLELVFKNFPPLQYVVDELAAKHDNEILRIPIKHCVLNPIEFTWASFQNDVLNIKVNFSIADVAQLCNQSLADLQPEQPVKYFSHVKKCEEEFK
ncbi:unnamed protein product [Rotaria socialis]|uniref:Uncharacterized protein n=1 Tax=Rotaria socialis TaxID=392032 RepID=A0A819AB71_9BILA|nr:unnamed protein product [Rotaria socialis]